MKKLIALMAITTLLLTGCVTDTGSNSTSEESTVTTTASDSMIEVEYKAEDLDSSFDPATATTISLQGTSILVNGAGAIANGSILTIQEAGTYIIEGTLSDGQILVEAGEEDLVRIVLNGVDITCSDNAAIWSKTADKTVVILAPGTSNQIADGTTYVDAEAEDAANAAVFSQNDLTVNGTGTLAVTGNFNNGIGTKDDLKIVDSVLTVSAVNDGIKGKDSVAVKDATLTVNAAEDAIQSDQEEATEKGWIAIDGGTFVINAGDDGIHAETILQIDGANIDVQESYEGLEASTILVNSGTISVKSEDDGFNGAGGDGSAYSVTINGGAISVDAAGDGLDSNGSIYINGGTILVNGPTNNKNGSLDYNGVFDVTGGILVFAGSSGMAQAPSATSTQNSLLIYYSTVQKAGTLVSLLDDQGELVVAFAPTKDYQSIVVSLPNLAQGQAYQLQSGGSCTGQLKNDFYLDGSCTNSTLLAEVTLSAVTTAVNEDGSTTTPGMGGMGGHIKPEGMEDHPPTLVM